MHRFKKKLKIVETILNILFYHYHDEKRSDYFKRKR